MKNTFLNQKGKNHRYIYFIIVGLLLGSFFGSLIHNTVGADPILISDSILIDSLDDYSKLGFDITKIDNPVVYEKECLVEGHMPIVIKFNNVASFSISEKSNLVSSVETSKSGFNSINYVYRILQSYVYFFKIPVYKNETIIIKDAKNNTESKQIVSVFAYYKDVSEVRYHWIETKDLSSLSVDKSGFIVVDVIGKFKAELGNRQMDVVPKLSINGVKFTLNKFAWWNSSWLYCKTLNIANKNLGYQIKLIVGNSTGGNVTCESHLEQGKYFKDIRFVKSDNSGEYYHWMENYTNNVQATFWVNNSDNASSILMYYSNSLCVNSTYRNPHNTFYFYSDVDDVANWVHTTKVTVSASGGYVNVVGTLVTQSYYAYLPLDSAVSKYIVSIKSQTDHVGTAYWGSYHELRDGDSSHILTTWGFPVLGTDDLTVWYSGGSVKLLDMLANTDYILENYMNESTNKVKYVLRNSNSVYIANSGIRGFYNNINDGLDRYWIYSGSASPQNYNIKIKYIFITKWCVPFSSWSSFGSEQENTSFEIKFGLPSPVNGSLDVALIGSFCILINESGGHSFNYSFNMSNGLNSSGNNVYNGSKCLSYNLICGTNYTVWVNASNIYTSNSSVYWFITTECVYCTYQTYNYSNLSLYWWVDLTSDNGTFNYTIECSNGQNISGTWVSNGTYGIFLYNLSYNTTYTTWVNCSTHLCGTNESYLLNTGWNINEGDFVMIAGFSMDADLLFLGICLSLWIFFISKYLEYKDMTISYIQFGLSIPTCIIVGVFSLSYPFGFVIVFLIPILSLSLMADSYFYRKKQKKEIIN